MASLGNILAPWHLGSTPGGGPFWQLGTILEKPGGSRMDTRWSGTGFASSLEGFWDPYICVFEFKNLEI